MSTARGNDRLITANYSARTFLLSRGTKMQLKVVFCTMDPQCELDCCKLCGFVFLDKRRKKYWGIEKIPLMMIMQYVVLV